jgi:hypothetical protein
MKMGNAIFGISRRVFIAQIAVTKKTLSAFGIFNDQGELTHMPFLSYLKSIKISVAGIFRSSAK